MAGLFISYRREDLPGFAGRLADALEAVFGAENVFRDIEDIRPGDDFVEVIERQLREVDALLVVIGPSWLTANRDGVRRLDEADDFVRQEIHAGLESGKPVLPVLIGGGIMPAETDLPLDIRRLARRQAVVLSDSNWTTDVARLVDLLRPLLPARRRGTARRSRLIGLIGLIVVAAIALLAAKWLLGWVPLTDAPSDHARLATQLNGRWRAEIRYDWGESHPEVFEFAVDNGEVHGTASYLRVARTIEEGHLQAERLVFVTHSREMQSDGPGREVTHRYRGKVVGTELHVVLESTGGSSQHSPVDFIAVRIAR
jgi:hypothetical protein